MRVYVETVFRGAVELVRFRVRWVRLRFMCSWLKYMLVPSREAAGWICSVFWRFPVGWLISCMLRIRSVS